MRKEEYRKRMYHEYLSQVYPDRKEITRGEIEKSFPIWDRQYKEHLPPDRSAAIIDIGCGSGGFVHYLRQAGYNRAAGIDISQDQVAASRLLGISGVSRGEFRVYLSSHPSGYDAVIARDVIEHFSKEEALELMVMIREALSANGVCLIQTLNAESPFWPRYRYGDFTHEMSFTASSIRSALLLAGFREAASFPVPPVFQYSLNSAVRVILWKGIEFVWRTALLAESGSVRGIITGNLITVAYK